MSPLKGHDSHVENYWPRRNKVWGQTFQNLFLRSATFLSSLPLLSSTSPKAVSLMDILQLYFRR